MWKRLILCSLILPLICLKGAKSGKIIKVSCRMVSRSGVSIWRLGTIVISDRYFADYFRTRAIRQLQNGRTLCFLVGLALTSIMVTELLRFTTFAIGHCSALFTCESVAYHCISDAFVSTKTSNFIFIKIQQQLFDHCAFPQEVLENVGLCVVLFHLPSLYIVVAQKSIFIEWLGKYTFVDLFDLTLKYNLSHFSGKVIVQFFRILRKFSTISNT